MKTSLRLALLLLLCVAPVVAQPPAEPAGAIPTIPQMTAAELEKLVGAPTTITLKMQGSAGEILAAIGQQANLTIGNMSAARAANTEQLAIDYKNEPFWGAVQTVGRKADLHINDYAGFVFGMGRRHDLSVVRMTGARKGAAPLLSVPLSPYVTFDARSVVVNQSRAMGFDSVFATAVLKQNRAVTIGAQLLLDPKLSRFPAAFEMAIDNVTTDNGAVLQAASPYLQPGSLTRSFTLSMNSEAPVTNGAAAAVESKKITALRGKLIVVVARSREVWEIADVMNAKNVTKSVRMPSGVWRFTFGGVKALAGRYTANLVAERPAGAGATMVFGANATSGLRALAELQSAWMRSLRLEDAQGQTFFSGGASTRGEGTSMVVDMAFTRPVVVGGEANVQLGLPTKLTIEIPTDFRQIEIPFEIRDIPLP